MFKEMSSPTVPANQPLSCFRPRLITHLHFIYIYTVNLVTKLDYSFTGEFIILYFINIFWYYSITKCNFYQFQYLALLYSFQYYLLLCGFTQDSYALAFIQESNVNCTMYYSVPCSILMVYISLFVLYFRYIKPQNLTSFDLGFLSEILLRLQST